MWLMLAIPCVAQQSDEQVAAYYFDQGELEQAAEMYETLYKRGHNAFHYQRLLETYLRMEHYRDAKRLVEQRKKDYPKELALLVDEGNILMLQKHAKQATKCFEQAITRIGNDLQPIPELAMAFQKAGRYDYAARTYLTAREHSKNRTLYFNELITVYQQSGNYEAMTNEYFDLLDRQPGLMQSVQSSMQKSLQEAPDSRLSDGVRRALVSRVQEHPDSHVYLEMMIWFALQMNDFQFAIEQAEAVNARFPDKGSVQLLRVARIAQANGDYEVAARGYRDVREKGKAEEHYFEARVGELEVKYLSIGNNQRLDTKSLTLLRDQYLSALEELGKDEKTVPLMRHFASLMAYHGGSIQEAVDMLDDVLELKRLSPHVRDEVKLELGDLLLFAGQTWDASLMYMQVEKSNHNDVLGSTAKLKNAYLSYFMHDFSWARSQLEVLRAATSKLIANDAMELSLLISDNMDEDSTYTTLALFADADFLRYQGRYEEAMQAFSNVEQSALSHPLFDEVLLRKAEISIKLGQYSEADQYLQKLIDFYPYDITADDALMMQAELNEQHLANPTKALQCYETLLLEHPSSLFVEQARKQYNKLKKNERS